MTALTIAIASGQRGGDEFFDNILLAVIGLTAVAAGVASFIIGVIGIFRQKERAWLLFITTFIGLLVTLFLLGGGTVPALIVHFVIKKATLQGAAFVL